MPPKIEKAIQKTIWEFLWDGEGTPNSPKHTWTPPGRGGSKPTHQKQSHQHHVAQILLWLKSYLNFSLTHPTWAIITDLLINKTAPPNISPLTRINTYTQSWNPPRRGPRATNLNRDIVRMINTARKYNMNLAALRITPDISTRLPAWFHMSSHPGPMIGIATKCLLNKHSVKTVADLIQISKRVQQSKSNQHLPNLMCTCINCAKDCLKGCRNPHGCAEEALTQITHIAPLLNPLTNLSQWDNFSLTPAHNTQCQMANEHQDKILSDSKISCKTDLAECFCIFTDPNQPKSHACQPEDNTHLD